MKEIGLAGRGGLALVGVGVTQYVDKHFDSYAYNLKITDSKAVKITPGLMLTAAALLGAWAAGPGALRVGLASAGIGGLASESAPTIKAELVDALPGPAAPAVKGLPYGHQGALPQYQHVGYGPFAGDLALKQAMLRWGHPG